MQIVWRGPGRRLGGLSQGFRGVGHLSLSLGCLQLESWVGMTRSIVLRHPEGTTELLPQLEREGRGLELAQLIILFAAIVHQREDRQHEEG